MKFADRTDDVRSGVHALVAVERRLKEAFDAQHDALRAGDPERITRTTAELDERVEELRRESERLRATIDDLAAQVGLAPGSRLLDIARAHPDPDAGRSLMEIRSLLARARREARSGAAINAQLARASLEAVQSVRGILVRATGGDAGGGTSALSRLDASV